MWHLWDYGDLVDTYSDEEAAIADRNYLIEKVKRDRAALGSRSHAATKPELNIVLTKITPRTKPRYVDRPDE